MGFLVPQKRANKKILVRQKEEARLLGWKAVGAGLTTALGTFLLGSLWLPLGVLFSIGGIGITTIQVKNWLQFRGKWGLRF